MKSIPQREKQYLIFFYETNYSYWEKEKQNTIYTIYKRKQSFDNFLNSVVLREILFSLVVRLLPQVKERKKTNENFKKRKRNIYHHHDHNGSSLNETTVSCTLEQQWKICQISQGVGAKGCYIIFSSVKASKETRNPFWIFSLYDFIHLTYILKFSFIFRSFHIYIFTRSNIQEFLIKDTSISLVHQKFFQIFDPVVTGFVDFWIIILYSSPYAPVI